MLKAFQEVFLGGSGVQNGRRMAGRPAGQWIAVMRRPEHPEGAGARSWKSGFSGGFWDQDLFDWKNI